MTSEQLTILTAQSHRTSGFCAMTTNPSRIKRPREETSGTETLEAETLVYNQDAVEEVTNEVKRLRSQSFDRNQKQWTQSSERHQKQSSCPYLGTINRHVLDFDFEKLCSITLSNQRPYGCLVCGKFFQGIFMFVQLSANGPSRHHLDIAWCVIFQGVAKPLMQ